MALSDRLTWGWVASLEIRSSNWNSAISSMLGSTILVSLPGRTYDLKIALAVLMGNEGKRVFFSGEHVVSW